MTAVSGAVIIDTDALHPIPTAGKSGAAVGEEIDDEGASVALRSERRRKRRTPCAPGGCGS